MKQIVKRSIIASAAAALLATPAVAFAHDGLDDALGNSGPGKVVATTVTPAPSSTPKVADRVKQFQTELRDQLEQKSVQRQTLVTAKKAQLQEKLDSTKRKACVSHQNTINRLMTVMDKRRTNTLGSITKLSDAVQAFYVKKQLNVVGYDDLVAKVNAAKSVAEAATAAQQAVPSLDCSGDHPRADVADFKEKRAASQDAVRAYRDAVKDLVKAVKTAVGSSKATTSPTPKADGGTE